LLLAFVGPHLIAFPLEEVAALLPTAQRRLEGWIAGVAQYHREDVAVVSLHEKFGFTRSDQPTRCVIVSFADSWVAIEVDPNVRIADQATREIHPFRDALSTLPAGAVRGVVHEKDEFAFLLDFDRVFSIDDAVTMGEALFR